MPYHPICPVWVVMELDDLITYSNPARTLTERRAAHARAYDIKPARQTSPF